MQWPGRAADAEYGNGCVRAVGNVSQNMNEPLLEKIKHCPNLPSLPAIAMQVLDMAQSTETDTQEVARIISKDPALATKILRVVNSSFYARSQTISTINQALVILGLQSVKTLALGFSLAGDLTKRKGKGFNHLAYWKRSICAATAAKTLATKANVVQQDEAFLVGLLMDIGMLALESTIGDEYEKICESANTHLELVKAEEAALGMNHAEVGGFMAQQWKLPPVLATPMGFSHNTAGVSDPALKRLTELVEVSGLCGEVFVNENAAVAITAVRQMCQERYQLSETDTDVLLADIGKKTKEMAGLFEINIGSHKAFGEILQKAQDRIQEMALEAQRKSSELEGRNEQLQQQAVVLKEKATTDGLTGLSNRATFDEFLQEQFQAVTPGKPLTLLMMDVDKFKSFNDKHGHQAGDAVLKAVAGVVKKVARKQDMAARYGGEEMALVLPATQRKTGEMIADTLRRAVAATMVQIEDLKLSVTISIGLATHEAGGRMTSQVMLLKLADKAVYAAKEAGRNCVKVLALPPAAA